MGNTSSAVLFLGVEGRECVSLRDGLGLVAMVLLTGSMEEGRVS